MTRRTILVVFLLSMVALPVQTALAEAPPLPKNLAKTLDLYLSSDSSYKEGDLITKSHLQEFQVYLRRTQGLSIATHPRWPKRMLADRDALSQAFYNGGANIIRSAAKTTGGYAKIHQLGNTAIGRKAIRSALAKKSAQQLIDAVAALPKKQVSNSNESSKPKIQLTSKHLYTASDYIAALEAFQASKNIAKTASEPAISQEK